MELSQYEKGIPKKVEMKTMNENYVVTSVLDKSFGGRTKSLLQRTKYLTESFNLKFTMVTTNYNPNYHSVYKDYYEKSYIDSSVKFINVYDFFSKRKYKEKSKVLNSKKIKGHQSFEVEKDTVYRYFENGYYKFNRKFNKNNGRLESEDIMDVYNRTKKERIQYNSFGRPHRKIIYKRNTTNILEEIYYDEKGKVYLVKNFNGTDEKKLVRIYLFSDEEVLMFKTEKEFFKYAFEKIIQPGGVTFNDARLLDKPLIEADVETKKFFVIHSSHSYNNVLKGSYKYLFVNHKKADRILILTHEQKQDFVELEITENKLMVLPHSIDEPKTAVENAEREKVFVFVGRLSEEKQIPHIIEAFSKVVDSYKDYRLHIYGDGKEAKLIEEVIEKNNMTDYIKLKGKTSDIKGVFQNATASIMASKFEGLPLVMMESLHYGCPVISYSYKYGPKDLIRNNENGLIVEKDNVENLTEAIIKMINNPLGNVELSDDYYSVKTSKLWQDLLFNENN